LLEELIEVSISLGISNNVFFTGFQEDVEKYYSIADVLVMPSVSEPFGLIALEALACQTPVILSKQSGASEVIQHCLRADFWDTEKLAHYILGTLHYTALQQELQCNGYQEIQHFRGWEDVAKENMEVYQEAL
jgi:glycosyltransferase involved in cell wall biosynthesis